MVTLVVLLGMTTLLLVWHFVGYPYTMAVFGLRKSIGVSSSDYCPFVSILVPTYNERNVIASRINNLIGLDYPPDKYEILVVDSGSSDGTKDIVIGTTRQSNGTIGPSVRLLEEEGRKGKASAINFGKRYAKGEIILVTDANSVFVPDVLRQVTPFFTDEKTGAVSGRYIVQNRDTRIGSSTQFYWDVESLMRRGEACLDSACLFHGELNAWRKELIDADPAAISEDLDMSIRIRKMGYRIRYAYKALVYEPAPSTAAEQIKQRKRTSVGTIQAMFKHANYLFLPRDLYASLIFPSHKALVMISPFLLSLLIILYSLLVAFGHVQIALLSIFLTVIIFIIILIPLLKLINRTSLDGCQHVTRVRSIKVMLRILLYVLLNEWIVLLAWKDFAFGSYSVLWEKVESTRCQEHP